MKIEESLGNEGFEEIPAQQEKQPEQGSQNAKPASSGSSNRPDLRVVQTETDREGKTIYRNVGGMWRNVSKNGKEFYTLMIGNMKLLVFPNNK